MYFRSLFILTRRGDRYEYQFTLSEAESSDCVKGIPYTALDFSVKPQPFPSGGRLNHLSPAFSAVDPGARGNALFAGCHHMTDLL